jgi:branched-chain amino acid transport system permease protein
MEWADKLLQLMVSGIALGAVYGIVGLGFNIIYNATGVINFAQGEFVMLGGMVATSLVAAHVPIPVALVVSAAAVAVVGLLLERLAIRPLQKSSLMSMITVTIGASMLLRGVAKALWGPNSVALTSFSGTTPLKLGAVVVDRQELWVCATALVIVVGSHLFFTRTLGGKAMRACAINTAAARLAGVSVERMTLFAFGISAGMSGLAGVVLAPLTMVSYSSGTPLAVKGFCAAIVGGLGNGLGAVIGGLLLGVLESVGAGLLSSGYKNAIALLVLLLVLIFRPGGVLGRKAASGL